MQEPAAADPAPVVDQYALHHRDLPGRAPERLQRDERPHLGGGPQRDDVARRSLLRRHRTMVASGCVARHTTAPLLSRSYRGRAGAVRLAGGGGDGLRRSSSIASGPAVNIEE